MAERERSVQACLHVQKMWTTFHRFHQSIGTVRRILAQHLPLNEKIWLMTSCLETITRTRMSKRRFLNVRQGILILGAVEYGRYMGQAKTKRVWRKFLIGVTELSVYRSGPVDIAPSDKLSFTVVEIEQEGPEIPIRPDAWSQSLQFLPTKKNTSILSKTHTSRYDMTVSRPHYGLP